MLRKFKSDQVFRYAGPTCCAIGITVALISVSACTVTDPAGNTWRVDPTPSSNGPVGGTVVGTFVGPDGNTYRLIDVNGDGVPDFAQGPDGRWRKITPPDQPIPAEPPSTAERTTTGGGQPIDPEPWNEYWSEGVDWSSGIVPPVPFDFGTSDAGDWVTYFGMDVSPGQLATTSGLHLHQFDTTTLHTDAVFYSSSDFAMPDIEDFDLDYEFYGLLGEQSDPDFLSMRVAGNLEEVIRFAFEIGDGVQEFSFTDAGGTWTVVADEPTMHAMLFRNGSYQMSMAIN